MQTKTVTEGFTPRPAIICLSIILLSSFSLSAQVSNLNDTVKIKEVIVRGKSLLDGQGGKIVSIDSSILKDYSHDNISSVISENSSIFIKNYGSGGIATVSLRGTGAGYTGFSWNGVNIGSPMLGQSDLTLIPAGFIDDLKIMYGGTSLLLNSGGMGGIINIETKPSWDNRIDLLTDLSAGSFGRYSSLLKIRTGNTGFQSSTRALFQSFENSFPYINNFSSPNPESEKRKNAKVNQSSFLQELYFREKKSVISARIWYQRAERNIPVPISMQQPDQGETQKDEFLRTMIGISGYKGKINYGTTLSWFAEKQHYINPSWSVNSRNTTNMLNLRSNIRTVTNEKMTLDFIFNDELSIANSVNYDTIKYLNLASLTISARRIYGNRTGITLLVRETVKNHQILIPDFLAGFDYRIFEDHDYLIKANFSHNSKVPTLNDLYWNPGGNESLKNESCYSGEISYEMTGKISEPFSFTAQMTMFFLSIDNMIKWIPEDSGLWFPVNINKTGSTGIEGSFGLLFSNNFSKVRFNAKYAWNETNVIKSGDDEFAKGKQLIYSPEHLLSSSLRGEYKNIWLSLQSCYTGRRFTKSDNSDFLKGYFLNSISTGIKIGAGASTFDINLRADNIFNVNYQAIEWYPMPGRSFNLSVIYRFAK